MARKANLNAGIYNYQHPIGHGNTKAKWRRIVVKIAEKPL